ncbi:MAG TPA: ABC transporter permease [Nitrospiraceae bacterium]|nr:ABC transporter permease [Nitrospiraceae bacterium]
MFAVANAEFVKLKHDPLELLMRAVQPILWLVIFGNVMGRIRGMAVGTVNYQDFLAPGILAQSVLFAAIFYGISAIWERDLGIIHRYLVSPASRTAILLGKQVSASIRGISQAAIIYVIALVMGLGISFQPLKMAGVVILISLGSGLFANLSLIIACIVKTRERFMGIGQVITMPIFFVSNAIYPLDLMPGWIRGLASANPLTYEVDGLRMLMLRTAAISPAGLARDFSVLFVISVVLLVIATRLYPRMAA